MPRLAAALETAQRFSWRRTAWRIVRGAVSARRWSFAGLGRRCYATRQTTRTPPLPTLSLVIRPEQPNDAADIARLEARAFGPGRFARTAYRLREGTSHRIDLGVTASVGSFLVGSARMSPVRAGDKAFLMLGPLAVDPSFEGRGIGTALTRAAIEAARRAGEGLTILVGDAPYYTRFGFTPVPRSGRRRGARGRRARRWWRAMRSPRP